MEPRHFGVVSAGRASATEPPRGHWRTLNRAGRRLGGKYYPVVAGTSRRARGGWRWPRATRPSGRVRAPRSGERDNNADLPRSSQTPLLPAGTNTETEGAALTQFMEM